MLVTMEVRDHHLLMRCRDDHGCQDMSENLRLELYYIIMKRRSAWDNTEISEYFEFRINISTNSCISTMTTLSVKYLIEHSLRAAKYEYQDLDRRIRTQLSG